MNAVLNKSAKQVKTLSARANKGTIKSLYLQIEMGKICSTAHAYWKANKKELGITRDELTILHGFKSNTFFGELRSASNIPIEDTEKYIQSLGDEPTASIKGLLAFVKPAPPEKVPNMFSFSQAKYYIPKQVFKRPYFYNVHLSVQITLINTINTSGMTLINIFVIAISTAIIMQVSKDIIS